MASGFGRGGRGAAIMDLLQKKARAPGESDESSMQPAVSAAPSACAKPMGRGAFMQSYLAQKSAASGNGAPSAPAGRASLLAKFTQQKSDSTQPVGRGSFLASAAHSSAKETPAAPTPTPPQSAQAVTPSPASMESSEPTRLALQLQHLDLDRKIVVNHGKEGDRVPLATNSLRLLCRSKGMYQYAVSFNPPIDSKEMRFHLLLDEHKSAIPEPRMFDGAILCLLDKLAEDEVTLSSVRPTDKQPITIKIKLVKVLPLSACVPQINGIFKKIMRILKMTNVAGRYFDSTRTTNISQHRLEVWPGYITSAEEQEGGLLLLVDTSHKVLRTETVREKMQDVYSMCRHGDFKTEIARALIGETVLTRYNNKTYRIDDIAWDMSPRKTFRDHTGAEISYMDYYKHQYNRTIEDPDQPLLLHIPKQKTNERRRSNRPPLERILLVPELCNLTGLTDNMRKDFRIMKDLGTHTRLTPAQREVSIRKFAEEVNSQPQARQELDRWGLTLETQLTRFDGRLIRPLDIKLGDREVSAGPEADWGRALTRAPVITAVEVRNWLLVFPNNDRTVASEVVTLMQQEGPRMGIRISAPARGGNRLPDMRNESYVTNLRSNITQETQLVVCLLPRGRDDLYSALKTLCCHEIPVPSQMIVSKTVADKKKQRSVIQKVILQINVKLGGELWGVKMPKTNLMVCGVDVYHDKNASRSVGALVCAMNTSCTRWYSRTCEQMRGQEMLDALKPCFIAGIRKFAECNQRPPDRIILFRDGVGDGQLGSVAKHEARQLEECFAHFAADYRPKLTVVVVQKRINQRILTQEGRSLGNPPPGTIVDHTITRASWYDFFLVSQHVRQGTVSPTHYVVVHDHSGWECDRIQKLSYMLTHLYYNWPGTVRVPAPCQYAHKLAQLQGQNIRKPFAQALADRLFYL